MHFQGQQLVSRETHVSSRSLVSLSAVIIFIVLFELNLADFKPMGLLISSEKWQSMLSLVLIFLIANHAFSYWGDYLSLKRWNVIDKVVKNSTQTLGDLGPGGGTDLITELENLIDILRSIKGGSPDDGAAVADAKSKLLSEAVDKLSLLSTDIKKFTMQAKFYFYVWYGLVPFGLSIVALFLMYDCP